MPRLSHRRCDAGTRAEKAPQRGWTKKRERQYEHIKDGLTDRGRSEDVAEEIAARTQLEEALKR